MLLSYSLQNGQIPAWHSMNGDSKSALRAHSPWWEVISLTTWSFALGVSAIPFVRHPMSRKDDFEWIYFLFMELAYLVLAIVSGLRLVGKVQKKNETA